MDKNAAASLDALDKKIESLLARKELVLKKERERKAKAQEKWKGLFQKEIIKGSQRFTVRIMKRSWFRRNAPQT